MSFEFPRSFNHFISRDFLTEQIFEAPVYRNTSIA